MAELEEFEDDLPYISSSYCWWLADIADGSIAYAEGNNYDEDMYCLADEDNTYIRAALELSGTEEAGLSVGDEFEYCGIVFTLLSDTLAISNNFVGKSKYESDDFDNDESPVYEVLSVLFDADVCTPDDCDEDE